MAFAARGLWGAVAGLIFPTLAFAGAWPVPKGETLAILKYEGSGADTAFDVNQFEVAIPGRRDDGVSLFVEHGLTSTLTFQGKAGLSSGHDGSFDYSGAQQTEIGLRQLVFRRKDAVISVYAGAVFAGEGHNAGYAPPGQGDGDVEVRVLAGNNRKFLGKPVFQEVQVARLWRRGLPNEWRMDTTVGLKLSPRWMVLSQTYAGLAQADGFTPYWVKAEASVVRRFGDWSVQGGWRRTVFGREQPIESGPVVAIWRRF